MIDTAGVIGFSPQLLKLSLRRVDASHCGRRTGLMVFMAFYYSLPTLHNESNHCMEEDHVSQRKKHIFTRDYLSSCLDFNYR